MAVSWIPIALCGAGLLAMAVLSALATPDETKKIVYIEKDLKGKKNIRRKKTDETGGGNEESRSKFHPTNPWGGS